MSNSEAGAAAFNPTVLVNGVDAAPRPPRSAAQQQYLDAIAEQAEQAVEAIKGKVAGMQVSLATAEAEADRARAEAQDGVN